MNQEFHMIFTLARLNGIDCVIAGGAAACFDKATDIDVFTLGEPVGFNNAERLLTMLGGEIAPYSHVYGDSWLVGAVQPLWSCKPIQVIGSHSPTVDALLESFDLSVHAWAITPDGRRRRVAGSTELHEPIRGLQLRDYRQTRSRLRKLRKRYGWTWTGRLRRALGWRPNLQPTMPFVEKAAA